MKFFKSFICAAILMLGAGFIISVNAESPSKPSAEQDFHNKIESVIQHNNELLSNNSQNSRSSNTVLYKASVTYRDTQSLSDIESFIRDTNVTTHAIYLRFIKPDGSIGTGYQILDDTSSNISYEYIDLTEQRGVQFDGVASLECILTASQYHNIMNTDSVYVVNLGETVEPFPEDFFWELAELGLTER